jgi:hypothetical protein
VDKKTGLISGWVYSKGANKVPLQPHEVIFFRYFNPTMTTGAWPPSRRPGLE